MPTATYTVYKAHNKFGSIVIESATATETEKLVKLDQRLAAWQWNTQFRKPMRKPFALSESAAVDQLIETTESSIERLKGEIAEKEEEKVKILAFKEKQAKKIVKA